MTKKQADAPEEQYGEPHWSEDDPPAPQPQAEAGPLEWQEGYRSMLDNPAHPLHHLRNA